MTAYEVCRQCGKPIVMTFRPAIFDRDILAFDGAGFLQALVECRYEMCIRTGRSAVEIADHRHHWLLRARGERPSCRTTEQRDELAPPQVGHRGSSPADRPTARSTYRTRAGKALGQT